MEPHSCWECLSPQDRIASPPSPHLTPPPSPSDAQPGSLGLPAQHAAARPLHTQPKGRSTDMGVLGGGGGEGRQKGGGGGGDRHPPRS